jgi:hypothetical protein
MNRPPKQSVRLLLLLLGALLLGFLLFEPIASLAGAWGCWVLGALYFGTGLWLWNSGRARLAYCLGLMVAGFSFASVGVAVYLNTQPAPPNPLADRPEVYYSSWLNLQRKQCARQLQPGERLTLTFEPGRRNVLKLDTSNVPLGRQRSLADAIERDFKRLYAGAPIQIRLFDNGRPVL